MLNTPLSNESIAMINIFPQMKHFRQIKIKLMLIMI